MASIHQCKLKHKTKTLSAFQLHLPRTKVLGSQLKPVLTGSGVVGFSLFHDLKHSLLARELT
jgi:hypothetical protein